VDKETAIKDLQKQHQELAAEMAEASASFPPDIQRIELLCEKLSFIDNDYALAEAWMTHGIGSILEFNVSEDLEALGFDDTYVVAIVGVNVTSPNPDGGFMIKLEPRKSSDIHTASDSARWLDGLDVNDVFDNSEYIVRGYYVPGYRLKRQHPVIEGSLG